MVLDVYFLPFNRHNTHSGSILALGDEGPKVGVIQC